MEYALAMDNPSSFGKVCTSVRRIKEMTDDRGIVHVTFGPSRSQSIRDALRLGGCEERVISLPGSLNFGPIDPPDPDVRRQWIANVLRCDADDDRSELESP
jgi:hypothetical protein